MTGTGHAEDVDNVGAYGASLFYDLQLTNSSANSTEVFVYLLAFDHGYNDLNYYGAAYIADPASNQWGVPSLCSNPTGIQAISLTTPDSVEVPPGGCLMRVGIANGGGATTPILLYISKIDAMPPVPPP